MSTTPEIKNDKYVVMKREHYNHLLDVADAELSETGYSVRDAFEYNLLDPDTYFVIRKGDILGFATLRSYVDNSLTLAELAKARKLAISEEQVQHLENLADMAAGMADKWQSSRHKIPD